MKLYFHFVVLSLYFVIFFLNSLQATTDLTAFKQDYILETKKFNFPGYPDAFNPSIVRWGGNLLMSFRIRDPITKATDQMGFVWLDESFNPIGNPYVLGKQIKVLGSCEEQDPRLITIHDHLYMVYSNTLEPGKRETRRVHVARVHFDGLSFFIKDRECLKYFEGSKRAQEKNWTPFVYNDIFYLSYTLNPHHVLRPLLNGSGYCETSFISKSQFDWKWGELRGGTTALLTNGQYLSFFHSSKDMITQQSGGSRMVHYFMGAFTFSAHPPFELTAVSPEPFSCKSFYTGPTYKTWKPLRVIFPGGFVQNDQYIWVSYGRQDHEAWIVKLDKQKLLQSLVPVTKTE